MPNFIGRPNLPNALANSLVQLAANKVNPMAEALKALGGVADEYGNTMAAEKKEKKKTEADDKKAKDGRDHDIKLKEMDISARKEENRIGLLTELIKNDQVVKGLMSAGDAQSMIDLGAAEGDRFVPNSPRAGAGGDGIPSEELGLPKGFSVIKKPEKKGVNEDTRVTVDEKLSTQFPALKGILGKSISTSQYMNLLRSQESSKKHRGTMDDKLWGRAWSLAKEDMEYNQAAMDGDFETQERIINEKKRLVSKTGGVVGQSSGAPKRKELGSIIADAFEKGLSQ